MVTIYDSASDVVQNSDVVFLCALPEQVDEVLDELKKANVWRQADHILVSLVVGPLLL
jgi:pyrroline-5-carboxylate reductase